MGDIGGAVTRALVIPSEIEFGFGSESGMGVVIVIETDGLNLE